MRFELGERFGVADWIAAQRDGDVVAAVLALRANAVREPPHRRMVEEQRLDDRLQHVDGVVVPANVRQLVRENRFDLRRRQRRERRDRQQNRGPQPSDHGRHVDERRFDDVRGGRKAQPIREAAARRLPAGG